ncbi:MAG: pre-peptidase C-terminal domain-containing protein [Methanomassiliicoccales archaeon]|nr:pre-peptidase C-terminal domain-containing protein [Methanomassiliicoccales archaeon]
MENYDLVIESVSDIDDLEDYYKTYVEAGEVLDYFLLMDPGTDLDLYLFNSDLVLVGQSSTDNPSSGVFTEQVTINATTTGWYYVSVYAYVGSSAYYLQCRSTASWTIMVYMDGDNNLEAQAIEDFLEMSVVGSTDEMNIVVQMDRISGYDSSFGGWTGVNRYLVSQGMEPTVAEAVLAGGEMNMGAASTLSGFINWGLENYPANHYMLVLWDHGGNWEGVCQDDSSSLDILTPNELATAFATVRATHPGFTFDVIGFDACVMSSLEVYYEIYGYTDYFIASQLNEPGPGWNYAMGLGVLASNPFMNGLSASIYMADAYVESYATPYPGYYQADVAMTVVDASIIPDIVSCLNTLSTEMIVRMPYDHNYYQTAWLDTEMAEGDYLDLLGYANNLRLTAPTAAVRSYASSLFNATYSSLEYVGYFDVAGGNDAGSITGISIYYPGPGYFDSTYRTSLLDMTAGSWDEMLLSFLSNVTEANDPVAISSRSPLGDVAVTVGSSQSFSVTVDDSDDDTITYLWYWDGMLVDVSGSGVTLYTDESVLGPHVLTVIVSDGASYVQTEWTVDVVTKADLSITDFLKWDVDGNVIANITSGRPSYAGATVTNSGGTDSVFDATCYLDGVPFCVWNDVSLAAGASVMLQSLPLQLSDVGMHTIQFLIDPLDEVDESDESNNGMAFAMNVVPAKWTVLVYMDGDNDLEGFFVTSFLEMSEVGSDANVSVVVQFDRIGGYDSRYGDWTDCLRFYVEKGMMPTAENATNDLGEVNMGSGTTLEDFLLWGMSTYQAERYVVVLKDHGNSWYGCCFDETSSNDHLTMTEITAALYSMTYYLEGNVDLLVMDDCLMGSFEVAVELSPYADFAVVSETVGWTDNYDYSMFLSFLENDPEMLPEDLAVGIMERMYLRDNAEHNTQCVAAYDLREMDGLILSFNDFVSDLNAVWTDDAGVLEMVRLETSHFQAVYGMDTVDMWDLVELCMLAAPSGLLSGTAVLQNLSSPGGVVLGYRYTSIVDYCHGMSLYFPGQAVDYHMAYTDCALFASESIWDDWLLQYLTASPPLTLGFAEGTEGLNGWYVSNVEISMSVYDPTNLGYDTYCSFNGTWVPYTVPFYLMGDGEYDLFYYSVGANTAIEELRGASLKVDVTKPTVEAFVDGYTLTLVANDSMSGVTSVLYSVDGGDWVVYSGPFAVGTVGHMYSVRYHAVDAAGNVGTDATVTVGESDDIAPVSSAEISGTSGTNGWYVSDVSVTLNALDEGGSGLQEITYSLDGGDWTVYSSPILCAAEGEHTLNYRAQDNFGNLEQVRTISFRIDLNAPMADSAINETAHQGWFSSPISIELSAIDPVSGVSSISYRVNGGAWVTYSNKILISSDGIWLVEWMATDNAGNEGTVNNITARIDTTAPSITIDLSGFNEEGWGLSTSTVECLANDTGSGVESIYYRADLGDWTLYSGALSFNATGIFILECYGVDVANNSGPVMNVTVRIDVSAPTTTLSLSGIIYEGQYLNTATVGYEIIDQGIGGTVLWYRLGDGNWTAYDETLTMGVGQHMIWYRSEDALGNQEVARSVNLTVISASVPDKVIGLSAIIEEDGVRLTWAAPDDGVLPITSFLIYRSDGSGPELLTTVTGTVYLDEDVEVGVTYTYQVVAINLLGEGTVSDVVDAEVPEESSNTMMFVIIAIIVVAVVAVAAFIVIRRR